MEPNGGGGGGLKKSFNNIDKLKCSGTRCKKNLIALVGGPKKISSPIRKGGGGQGRAFENGTALRVNNMII